MPLKSDEAHYDRPLVFTHDLTTYCNNVNIVVVFVQYLQSWVPDDNPCLICICLDHQHVNCTARPCNDVKGKRPPDYVDMFCRFGCSILMMHYLSVCVAPVCGPCEILREKRESKCCPEYECGR